jgi:error-prone DNA polymerase
MIVRLRSPCHCATVQTLNPPANHMRRVPYPNGRIAHACGVATRQQQPDTANGTICVSLADETGVIQVICWKRIREHQWTPLLHSRRMGVHGAWQRECEVMNLTAGRIENLTPMLGKLAESTSSRIFH